MDRNKYLLSSRGWSVHIYSKKNMKKKRWEGSERRGDRTDGRKDKRMDGEAGFGEKES